MNILHINTERGWRGGERQTFWLARELYRRGHRSLLVARRGGALARAAAQEGLPVRVVSPWSEWDPWSVWSLSSWIKKEKIDVVHAHTGHAVGLAALARGGTAAKTVATRRVDFPLRNNFLTRWKYGRMDRVVAISSAVKTGLLAQGISPQRVALIPSGIDTTGHPARDSRDRLRRERGIDPVTPLIVHVGALVPHKDQSTLLSAFAEVVRHRPDARLLILGDGPLRSALETKTQSLGLTPLVTFLGHRPDVLEYTAMADVFVFSSKEEGLGTALLDALALGVPTAATAGGGIPDLYGGLRAPELSPVGDAGALGRNILSVLNDPSEATARVERGRWRVADFSVTAMADHYEVLYRELVGA